MKTVKLWENETPGLSEGVNAPTLTYYGAENKKGDGAIVIFAGGGYVNRSENEGIPYAEFFNSIGLDAFVVDYRIAPKTRFPYELLDARRAVRLVRFYAGEYGIDPNKIAVIGSSAGGHLAALVSTYRGKIDGEGVDAIDEISPTPNAQILCYPVINATDRLVMHEESIENLLGHEQLRLAPTVSPDLIADEKTPQAFIWHTAEDSLVDVCNSYRYAERLHKVNVKVEMHIFADCPHGMALATEKMIKYRKLENRREAAYHVREWLTLLDKWLSYIGWKN